MGQARGHYTFVGHLEMDAGDYPWLRRQHRHSPMDQQRAILNQIGTVHRPAHAEKKRPSHDGRFFILGPTPC